jgi:hypothetical protein
MKKPTLLLLLILAIFNCYSQECLNYYYLTDNSEIELTIYDKKGNVSGKSIYKISNVQKDGTNLSSMIKSTFYNEKGKQLSEGEGKFRCNGASIDVDMKMSISGDQMAAYKDMEVMADDAYLNYPTKLKTGETLPDGKFSMEIKNHGTPFSSIQYDVNNRKVENSEKIASPAGSWDCFKISYEAKMIIRTMGIPVPMNFKAYEWYAPGFGIVKTESYSKNGKLMGQTLLTGIKK